MFDRDKGKRVLIVEDCRESSLATGKMGTHEGDQPIAVILCEGGEGNTYLKEISLEEYEDLKDEFPIVENWPPPEGKHAWYDRNPRIRLDDGSVIWGCECWWKPAEDASQLAQAQAALVKEKAVYNQLFEALRPEEEAGK